MMSRGLDIEKYTDGDVDGTLNRLVLFPHTLRIPN